MPPLIFESAASLEWHLFTKSKWYIFALACPGLILASGLTGIIINALMQHQPIFQYSDLVETSCQNGAWSTSAGLLLGVIMSSTDPVAVVALLKELGCKSSLSVVIEGEFQDGIYDYIILSFPTDLVSIMSYYTGESLLNDGTALVIFTILIKMMKGDTTDGVDDYIWTFVKMSLGGVIFGTAFAIFVVRWLGTIFNDALSEITITLSAAYLCFFISEYFFHVSGIIAVVCLGLYFGNSGRTSVSPEVRWQAYESFDYWYICNNLILHVL